MILFWKYGNRYSNVNLLSSRLQTFPKLLLLRLTLGRMLGSPFPDRLSSRIRFETVWLDAEVWALHTPYFRLKVLMRHCASSLIPPCSGVRVSIPHNPNLQVRRFLFVCRRDMTLRSNTDTTKMIPGHDDKVQLAGDQPGAPCQETAFP